MPAACDKKRHVLAREKTDAAFHLRVFHFVSDHAVFPAAVSDILSAMNGGASCYPR